MSEPEDKIDDTVCSECAFGNLVKNVGIKRCIRCDKAFCSHFACTITPLEYCVNCMGNLELERKVVTTKIDVYDPETDTVKTYRRLPYRSIHINGDDWLFAQRRIGSLSDVELELSIEFHREYLQLLAVEQDRRKAERLHKASQVKLPLAMPTGTTSKTVRETKTTTTTKQNKKVDQLSMVFDQMLNSGMSLTEIQALIAKSASPSGKKE